MKIDPDIKEVLEWFVAFAQMDLPNLKPGDRAKLFIEAQEALDPVKYLRNIGFPPDRIKKWLEKGIKLENGNVSKPFPAWFSSFPRKDTKEFWEMLSEAQKVIIQDLSLFSEMHDDKKGKLFINLEKMAVVTRTKSNLPFMISIIPLSENFGKYTQFKIHMLLNGLPASVVRKCHGCPKIFLNFSLREKKFCSDKCMWRVMQANQRAKDPKGYKAKQKKKMWLRYEEEQKNKYPGAKVKINRRVHYE
jgi:hypothetical protein